MYPWEQQANWNNTANASPYAHLQRDVWGQQPVTNVTYVTGIEDALNKSANYNSELIFFHQDQPIFYRVKVDNYGKKQWQEFRYQPPVPEPSTVPATQADLTNIVERLDKLEKLLGEKNSDTPVPQSGNYEVTV